MIVSDERVAKFVSEQLGYGLCPPFTAVGIERDGEVIAGVVFNHFEGTDLHVTVAGKGWHRGFLRGIGSYVFDHLGCERMTAITRCEDVAMIARRLGGKVEGRLRSHFGPSCDGILLGILREEYKF